MQRTALALVVGLLAGSTSADPIATNRPGESNPPSVVAPGAIQLEGGFSFERETDGSPNTNTLTVPQIQLRVGVLSFLEAYLFADGYIFEERAGRRDRSSGSDLTVGTRARVFDQNGVLPATALDFALSLPTGSDAVTSDGVDPTGSFLFEWILNDRFVLDANLVLASVSLGKGTSRRVFEVRPTASLTAPIGERAAVFIEYYAALRDSGAKDEHSVDGGISWRIGEDLQLDLSAGAGLTDAAPDFFISAGAAWRFFWTR